MSNNAGRYAQLPDGSNVVQNTILIDSDFTLDGYTFIQIGEKQACDPGSYYNENDGKFYIESTFENECGTVGVSDLYEQSSD